MKDRSHERRQRGRHHEEGSSRSRRRRRQDLFASYNFNKLARYVSPDDHARLYRLYAELRTSEDLLQLEHLNTERLRVEQKITGVADEEKKRQAAQHCAWREVVERDMQERIGAVHRMHEEERQRAMARLARQRETTAKEAEAEAAAEREKEEERKRQKEVEKLLKKKEESWEKAAAAAAGKAKVIDFKMMGSRDTGKETLTSSVTESYDTSEATDPTPKPKAVGKKTEEPKPPVMSKTSIEIGGYAENIATLVKGNPPPWAIRRINMTQEEVDEINNIPLLKSADTNHEWRFEERFRGGARGARGSAVFEDGGITGGWFSSAPAFVAGVNVVIDPNTSQTAERVTAPVKQYAVVYIENLIAQSEEEGIYFEVKLVEKTFDEFEAGIGIGFTVKDTAADSATGDMLPDVWGCGFTHLSGAEGEDYLTAVALVKSKGKLVHKFPTAWEPQSVVIGDTVSAWWTPHGIYFMHNLCVVAHISTVTVARTDLLGFFDLSGAARKVTLFAAIPPLPEYASAGVATQSSANASSIALSFWNDLSDGENALFARIAQTKRNHPDGYFYTLRVTRASFQECSFGFGFAPPVPTHKRYTLFKLKDASPLGGRKSFRWSDIGAGDIISILAVVPPQERRIVMFVNYLEALEWKGKEVGAFQAEKEHLHPAVELGSGGAMEHKDPTFATSFGLTTGNCVLGEAYSIARLRQKGVSGLVFTNGILAPRLTAGFTLSMHILIGGQFTIGVTNTNIWDEEELPIEKPKLRNWAYFSFLGDVYPNGTFTSQTKMGEVSENVKEGDFIQLVVRHEHGKGLVYQNGVRRGDVQVPFGPPYYGFAVLDDDKTVITV